MSPSFKFFLSGILGFVLALRAQKAIRRHLRKRGLPNPPGPRGYPVVGNLPHFPSKRSWLIFDEWFKTYGDMIYLEIISQPILVLGSLKRAQDLFDKRPVIYSDRPQLIMMQEIMNWNFNFAFLPYGRKWRRARRSFSKYFNLSEVHQYDGVLKAEAYALLRRLLDTPDDFSNHIRHTLGAITMKVAYGMTIQEENDPFLLRAAGSMQGAVQAGIPGRFLVELIPIMRYIPSWFPGAGWKRWGERCRTLNQMVTDIPFEYVKENIKEGTALPSVATSLIENLPDLDAPNRTEEEKLAKNTPAVAYTIVDTTAPALATFICAMCLFPDAQRRAQEELDHVFGGRMPRPEDQDLLPYVKAIMKECMRWRPLAPLVPHSTSEDDEYEGYFIPKGTIVFANTWTMLHDPKVYAEPSRFIPERFLKDAELDPNILDPGLAFGFGRRACPGRHFAERIIFTMAASLLSMFDLSPPLGEDGKPLKMEANFSNGPLLYPEGFQARITPRSKEVEVMLRASVAME